MIVKFQALFYSFNDHIQLLICVDYKTTATLLQSLLLKYPVYESLADT